MVIFFKIKEIPALIKKYGRIAKQM